MTGHGHQSTQAVKLLATPVLNTLSNSYKALRRRAVVAAKSATHIGELGGMIPDVFATDTRNKATVKTKAQDGVWTNQADFKAKADDLVKAATALQEAAKGGDKDATLKAAGAVGKACGACHDNFRNK